MDRYKRSILFKISIYKKQSLWMGASAMLSGYEMHIYSYDLIFFQL